MGASMSGFDGKERDLVLGRRTYEIFDAYWPYQPGDNPVAQALNAARKYVASRTLRSLDWNNSTLLGGDVVAAGDVPLGSFAQVEPSAKELERRAKWAREAG